MKVYSVTILIVDHDNIGADEVAAVIQSTRYPNRCIAPRVMALEEREVEWHERHPLNLQGQDEAAFTDLFGAKP